VTARFGIREAYGKYYVTETCSIVHEVTLATSGASGQMHIFNALVVFRRASRGGKCADYLQLA